MNSISIPWCFAQRVWQNSKFLPFLERVLVQNDKSIPIVLKILEFSKMVVINLISNIKIHLVLKTQQYGRCRIRSLILKGRLGSDMQSSWEKKWSKYQKHLPMSLRAILSFCAFINKPFSCDISLYSSWFSAITSWSKLDFFFPVVEIGQINKNLR